MIKDFLRKKATQNSGIYIVISSILHLGILIFLLKTYVPGFDKKSEGSTYNVDEITGLDKGTDPEVEILDVSRPTHSSALANDKIAKISLDIIQSNPKVEASKNKISSNKTKKDSKSSKNASSIAPSTTNSQNLKFKEEFKEEIKQAVIQDQDIVDKNTKPSSKLDLTENLTYKPVDIAHLNQPKIRIPKQLSKQSGLNFNTNSKPKNELGVVKQEKQNKFAKIDQKIPKQSNGRNSVGVGDSKISSDPRPLKIFQENELVPLTNHAVEYPERSQSLKEYGTVKVDLHFDKYGQLKNSKIAKSSGYSGLDNAVMEGVKSLSFRAMGFEFIYKASFHFQIENDIMLDSNL